MAASNATSQGTGLETAGNLKTFAGATATGLLVEIVLGKGKFGLMLTPFKKPVKKSKKKRFS
jgi:hypothetical protein